MKNKIIIFLILTSFSGFGQGIYRTLPNVTNTADSMKPVSTVQKAAIIQKLHTVATTSALQSFTDATVAQFDGSQWNKKSGNVASNGGISAGTIINVSASFYWERKTDYVTPKMFGAKGDQTTDDSQAFQNAVNAGYETVLITKGIYIVGDVIIPSNVKITTNENPVDFLGFNQKVNIIPKPTSSYIFNFATNARNVEISNLYISGMNYPSLIAAIKTNGGNFHNFFRNNIVLCNRHAIWLNSGNARLEHNNLQGLSSTTLDYSAGGIGTLHIQNAVDSYFLYNEIGAGSDYTTYKDVTGVRSCAVYAGFIGSSLFTGNIFEVADVGFYFNNGISNTFSDNRYEFNNKGGLILNAVLQTNFNSERFSNNSNVTAGAYDNVVIESGTSQCTFNSPIFNNLDNPVFTTKKVRHHISNKRTNDVAEYIMNIITPLYQYQSATDTFVNENVGYFPIYTTFQQASVKIEKDLNINGVFRIQNNPIISRDATYWSSFQDWSGNSALMLGGTNDPSNYYNNYQHVFRDRAGIEKMRLVNGNLGINKTAPNTKLAVVGLPTYADNTTALAAGLTAGDFYRTATGVLMVAF